MTDLVVKDTLDTGVITRVEKAILVREATKLSRVAVEPPVAQRLVVTEVEAVQKTTEVFQKQFISIGEQGPRGIQGPIGATGVGGNTDIVATAGVTLSGHRVVYIENGVARYADPTDPLIMQRRLGLTLNAAVLGDQATCRLMGEAVDVSFSFAAGPVYLATNGALTQVAPTLGVFVEVGAATAATTLVIDFASPIFIEGV